MQVFQSAVEVEELLVAYCRDVVHRGLLNLTLAIVCEDCKRYNLLEFAASSLILECQSSEGLPQAVVSNGLGQTDQHSKVCDLVNHLDIFAHYVINDDEIHIPCDYLLERMARDCNCLKKQT